jgi:hypothetical protein
MSRWYAKPDDLIGGWAVMDVDLTPGEVSDQSPSERAHMHEIANFVTREHAEEIARLHNDAERVSRLLWLAREGIDIFADLLTNREPGRGGSMRNLVDEIDAYRAERGWSPNGFGGELFADGVWWTKAARESRENGS